MNDDLQREEQLFSEALAIEDVAEREAFVCRATGDNATLRESVFRLLAAMKQTRRYFNHLDRPESEVQSEQRAGEQVGDQIGRYKLLEQIGEGGFGSVYVAEQDEPIRRRVALKIIKLGMDTKQVIARFEAERQALALMEHPNIAQVYDAGTTETGRPYFVMELVRGVPLTRFCDDNRLSPEQRLQLFIEVCDAVQHAHQKGIIHRDLKPSNILVTMSGHRAMPKVIDFGIAKATREPLTDKTLYTRFHQFIGTPEYISPEQAEMSEVAVDTRSDVYSLGVLLYELMVGRPPFVAQELMKAGFDRMRRMLREEDPLRPSRQLGRYESIQLSTTAERRRCVPQQLVSYCQGDLEQVILKAIEKDVDRRYASVAAFSEDIQRFLNEEPVNAVPPSRGYLLKKFVRRHRVGVGMAVLLVTTLLAGLGLSLAGFIKANLANARAEREAVNAETALNFIIEDLLSPLDPYANRGGEDRWGQDLSLLEAVQTAASGLGERFADQPLVEADIRLTIGRTYLRLGQAGTAEPHLERAVELFNHITEPGDARMLEARHYYAECLNGIGRAVEAIPIHEDNLALRQRTPGSRSKEALESMIALAWTLSSTDAPNDERAKSLFSRAISVGSEALGGSDPLVLSAKEGLAEVYYETGGFEQFIKLTDQVYEGRRRGLLANHPDLLRSQALRARELRQRIGDLHAAEYLGNEVLEKSLSILGPKHPTTFLMLSEKGERLQERGLWQSAFESDRELLSFTRQSYGASDPRTLRAELRLAARYESYGDSDEAERILRAGAHPGPGTSQTLNDTERGHLRGLARTLFQQGRVEESQTLYESVIRMSQSDSNDVSSRLLGDIQTVIALLGKQADWREIVRLYLEWAPRDFEVETSRKPLGNLPLPAGILAAQLAGNANATRTLLDLLTDRHRGETNLIVARQVALVGLALTPEKLNGVERKEVMRMAAVVLNQSPDPLERTLVSSMMAWRRGDIETAVSQLAPVISNPDHPLGATAGFVHAMALFRNGETNRAQQVIEAACESLEIGLRPGLLGHGWPSDFNIDLRWSDYARSLVLRNEAEAMIRGRSNSIPVTRDSLRARRDAWQSTQSLLKDADNFGRKRDWISAAEAFARAMDQGPINWGVDENLIRHIYLKAACAFALTGDTKRYNALYSSLVEHAETSQFYYGRPALLAPEAMSVGNPSVSAQLLEMARWRAGQLTPFQLARSSAAMTPGEQLGGFQVYATLQLGIAEYRAGNHTASLAVLAQVREAFELQYAGTAQAFSALAAKAENQLEKADTYLAEAESNMSLLNEDNPDRLSQSWHRLATFELAIREARTAIGEKGGR